MYRKSDLVSIRTEFQDPGDELLTWIVLDDEEKGRLDISPIGLELAITPIHTVRTDQVIIRSDQA